MALTTVPASLSATALTLTTAAQPNITSVGTLSTLTISGDLTVDTNTLKVESSNNRVLVGKSSTGLGNAGVEFEGGQIKGTSANQIIQYLNRTSSDGPIIEVRKDNNPVGVVGTVDGDLNVYATASGHKGLRFGNGYIAPTSNSTTVENNTVDLGLSTHKFKDGYFANSLYVGTNNSFFRENVVRFKSSGAAYFDHNTVGQDFIFRIGTSSTLDTTALVISDGTSTGYTLKVNGNIDIAQLKGSSGNAFLRFTDGDASADWSIGSDDGSGAGAGAFIMYDRSQSAYRAVINSSGRVGIGHTSPNARLHINAGNNSSVTIGDATNPALQIGGTTNYRFGVYTDGETAYIENKNGDDGLAFRVKTAGEAMRIDGGTGRVGIGDPTPRVKLEVHGGANEGIILKPNSQITYTPTSSNFYNGLTFENAGSGHAFSLAYGQGGWLKFSYFDNVSTYSEIAQLRSTGDFYPMGNVVMAEGKGISFINAADTALGETVSSSVLDDYEEGSWTPGIGGSSGGACTMGSSNMGRYVRIGQQVTVNATVHIASVPTLSGSIVLTGLPFLTLNQSNYRSNASPVTNTAITPGSGMTMLGIGVDANYRFAWIVGMNPTTKTYTHTPTVGTGFLYGFAMTYMTNS